MDIRCDESKVERRLSLRYFLEHGWVGMVLSGTWVGGLLSF